MLYQCNLCFILRLTFPYIGLTFMFFKTAFSDQFLQIKQSIL